GNALHKGGFAAARPSLDDEGVPLRVAAVQLIEARDETLRRIGAQKETNRGVFGHGKDLLAKSRAYYSIEKRARNGSESRLFSSNFAGPDRYKQGREEHTNRERNPFLERRGWFMPNLNDLLAKDAKAKQFFLTLPEDVQGSLIQSTHQIHNAD